MLGREGERWEERPRPKIRNGASPLEYPINPKSKNRRASGFLVPLSGLEGVVYWPFVADPTCDTAY